MSKPTRTKDREHARAIRKAAAAYKADGEKFWGSKGDDPDPHMTSTIAKDHTDLRLVARALDDGDRCRAADLASSLDTLVREVIPVTVWDYMTAAWA